MDNKTHVWEPQKEFKQLAFEVKALRHEISVLIQIMKNSQDCGSPYLTDLRIMSVINKESK